jgi:hypothetical protein
VLSLAGAAWARQGAAQSVEAYFPPGASGYDQQLGVTVQSRARPEYATPGVRLGGLVLHPQLHQALLYNSNPNGGGAKTGSWGSQTSAAVALGSDWTRNSIAAFFGVDNRQYFSQPRNNTTDWNVGLAGGVSIGDSQLAVAYAHQSYHQLGTTIGAVASEAPVLNQTDTARVNYTFELNRFAVTPEVSFGAYRFGTATVRGASLSQSYLDRNVLAAGVTTRYSMNDAGGLLVVVRATSATYIRPLAGQPSNDSNSVLLLGGVDYQAKGLWRYRLLAGVEMRSFAAPQFATRTSPIIEGSVIWTPTGLTTVTTTLSRAIKDPQSAATNGYVLNQFRLVVDHELLRNVLLQARGSVQYAEYFQAGSQTYLSLGASASWLVNRRLRASLDYDFARQTGAGKPAIAAGLNSVTTGQYSQNLIAVTLHFAL